jgi:hypothetical protein
MSNEKKSDICVTGLVDEKGGFVGIVKRGELGYYKTEWRFPTYEEAQKYADEYNKKLGVSEKEAMIMVLESMRKET